MAAMFNAPTASADVVHSVRFQTGPQIMTWGDVNRAETPALAPAAYQALPVMTGRLVPASFGESTVSGKSKAQFAVATNTAFKVRAEIVGHANLTMSELQSTMVELKLDRAGANADAALAAQPSQTMTLAALLRDPVIFQSARRTAAKAGTPRSQAVSFVAKWQGATHGVDVRFHVSAS